MNNYKIRSSPPTPYFIRKKAFVIPDKKRGILNTNIFIQSSLILPMGQLPSADLCSLFSVTQKHKHYYDEAFDGGYKPYGAHKCRENSRYKEKTTPTVRFSVFIHL